MANSCLRKSFGYDSKRLRFLYLSTVEPLLSYGCSVWLSALKTKTSIKTFRSFQRFAAQLITRSFKTAPTESLFVLANLLPLDLKLVKLAGVRYLSSKDGDCFSPSSLKTLVTRVPSVLDSPSIQPISSFFQPNQPPWSISTTDSLLWLELSCLCCHHTPKFSGSFSGLSARMRGLNTVWLRLTPNRSVSSKITLCQLLLSIVLPLAQLLLRL